MFCFVTHPENSGQLAGRVKAFTFPWQVLAWSWTAMYNEGSVMKVEIRDNHTLSHIKTQLQPECSHSTWLLVSWVKCLHYFSDLFAYSTSHFTIKICLSYNIILICCLTLSSQLCSFSEQTSWYLLISNIDRHFAVIMIIFAD